MSDENNEMESSSKRSISSYIGYAVAIVLIIALGIYIFRGQDTEREKTDTEITPTEAVDEKDIPMDETYQDFIKNLKDEINYIMTIENPDISLKTETAVCTEFKVIRDKIGRQTYTSYAVSYRDKSLCSGGKDCVVIDCSFEDRQGYVNKYQIRFDISARDTATGKRDYYVSSLDLSESK